MNFKVLKIKASQLIEEVFLRSWWVILFSLICLMFYEQSQKHRRVFFEELKEKLEVLNTEKKKALKLNQDLMLMINSQSDPAFVELTLMKVLGVISEGQVKVYFREKNPVKEYHANFNIENAKPMQTR